MNTDLARGIIDGKTLKQWWEETPYGAFQNKCASLGIKLVYGDADEKIKKYEVEISYAYSGRGTATICVEASSKEEAEELALDKFDSDDIDAWDAEVDDVEVGDITEIDN